MEQFPPPGLGDRFPLGKETFAGKHGNGREAPKADIASRVKPSTQF